MNNNKSSKVLAQIHFKKLVETSSVEDFKTLKRVVYVEKIKLCKRNYQFLVFRNSHLSNSARNSCLLIQLKCPSSHSAKNSHLLIKLEIPIFSSSK